MTETGCKPWPIYQTKIDAKIEIEALAQKQNRLEVDKLVKMKIKPLYDQNNHIKALSIRIFVIHH